MGANIIAILLKRSIFLLKNREKFWFYRILEAVSETRRYKFTVYSILRYARHLILKEKMIFICLFWGQYDTDGSFTIDFQCYWFFAYGMGNIIGFF